MVFSSIFFLFYFLPVVLLLYFVSPVKCRNLLLLLVSLFFYSWGEGVYVLLMLFVVTINYFAALQIDKIKDSTVRKSVFLVGIVVNLLPLLYYKYSPFLYENLAWFGSLGANDNADIYALHLPLGISFFTFQAMSYLIDTYRRTSPPQKNPVNLGLYIALFPQLIAGPIVRYKDVSKQILQRTVTAEGFSYGVERFVYGLGKKVLLANPLGQMADLIWSFPTNELTGGAAWLGAVCYTLQIYYDFSGYSDMAIGLGRMFGFTFLENFNFPYAARSIQDFWRRWHMSLSNWFKDYLYIPLGGNRKGKIRTVINLYVVFLLCGLWHGASWTFVLWGFFHGLFLGLERGTWGALLQRLPAVVQAGYTLLVVVIGWVLFRSETLDYCGDFLKVMFAGRGADVIPNMVVARFDSLFITTLIAAIIVSIPWKDILASRLNFVEDKEGTATLFLQAMNICFLFAVFLFSAASLANGAYNPFIYFRF